MKPVLSDWVIYILWFFIFIDIYFNVSELNNKMKQTEMRKKKKANPTKMAKDTETKNISNE